MKLFICNKAAECLCNCRHRTPHESQAYTCRKPSVCPEFNRVHCIRYRHPLEVAILFRIWELHGITEKVVTPSEAEDCRVLAKELWRVLKAGRNAE